jgi:peptidoglycan/xylan/chitin deacetylase (PgdA/CDA1 family)
MKRAFALFLLFTMFISGCSPRELSMEEKAQLYTAAVETVDAQLTVDYLKIPTSTETPIPPTPEPTATETQTLAPTLSPTPSWVKVGPGEVNALIIGYNSVATSADDDPWFQWESNAYIPVESFRYQLKVLKEAGYTSIPVSLLADAILSGAEMPPKPVIITFETSRINMYKIVFPIMKEYGFTGTLFLVQDYHNGKNMMTSDQIKELIAAGWEIGSKGKTSSDLTAAGVDLGPEISGSKLFFEEQYGVPVTIFSYPAGSINESVTSRVAGWGYKAAVGLFKATTFSMANLYYLPRYEILNTLTDEEFNNILPWKPANVIARDATAQPTAVATVQPTAAQ